MKLLSLNTWGGKAGIEKLLQYLTESDADIICLQEVWNKTKNLETPYGIKFGNFRVSGRPFEGISLDLLSELKEKLSHYNIFFRPCVLDFFGLAIFSKKKFEIISEGHFYIHRSEGDHHEEDIQKHARNAQYIHIKIENKVLTVINVHGVAGGEKKDTPERLIQSERLIQFIKDNALKGPYLLCGDFNLLPETRSISMFENINSINYIKKFNIQSTRSHLYEKDNKFADYLFSNDEIILKDFYVDNITVSDHLPLILDFELK